MRTLQSMGQQHAYAISTRLQQMSDDQLQLNQGTLYPALVRLEQQGRIKGVWDRTENGREAKFYAITNVGEKALAEETRRWRRMSGLVEKLLSEGA
jgi:transcriptional regulator